MDQMKTENKWNFRVLRFSSIDSTNEEVIRRARAGEAERLVVMADHQTVGRGREGRKWESPAGKNLYLSFLLRPNRPPSDAVKITPKIAFVVEDLLRQYIADGLRIKAPNDLLIHDKKVAGILCEMSSEGERIRWVVCGVGINVNTDLDDFSPEVRNTATSLKIETGKTFDREKILDKLLEKMMALQGDLCG